MLKSRGKMAVRHPGCTKLRDDLNNGEKVVHLGEGQGAVAKASLIGISSRSGISFFPNFRIVLLTLLVNATTIKSLVMPWFDQLPASKN